MIADLHTHTCHSDGILEPDALIKRARARGVTDLAITDHDSVAAIRTIASQPLPAESPALVAGTEISCLWQEREIHIVGLCLDPYDPTLEALLAEQQALRWQRIAAIDERLVRKGVEGLTAYVQDQPCDAPGRNHAADFLIRRGMAGDRRQAFKKFLAGKGALRVAAHWCAISNAVETIHAAGGIAVLAHPNRYGLSNGKLEDLLGDFSECGGQALEVSYSNLAPAQMQKLADSSRKFDLWASAGSDFHDPKLGWMDIGRIRELPGSCASRAIWHHPRWRHFSAGG